MTGDRNVAAKPIFSNRFFYGCDLSEFLAEDEAAIIGKLTTASSGVEGSQRFAWEAQIRILKDELGDVESAGSKIFFEYVIPRLGSRIDVVLIVQDVLYVVEFKVGSQQFSKQALDQVWDYGLDLVNFHSMSQSAAIVPILIATEADPTTPILEGTIHSDGLLRPIRCGRKGLREIVSLAENHFGAMKSSLTNWEHGTYQPTPTIIEAARALFSGHTVEDIARSDASAKNLAVTCDAINEIIEDARSRKKKSIAFVTGVPGAGKTLVGLNVAAKNNDESRAGHAVYLSGNGPLVAVLKEALVRDRVKKAKDSGSSLTKVSARQAVKGLIQSVHHFRDAAIGGPEAPVDHVAIFDEAQRAWNRQQLQSFMSRKRNIRDYPFSEPECLIDYVNRHQDWACIVCLIGGGQEIHTGEGGVVQWISALADKFDNWHVYITPNLEANEDKSSAMNSELSRVSNLVYEPRLHLSVSMRSFRAEQLSEFVRLTLNLEAASASDVLQDVIRRYPIYLSRDLSKAKLWLREQARGSERTGVVVSSQAQRLKPLAIDVRPQIDPVHWFLGDSSDVRSSNFLEDAASEFVVQGLELDWTCVVWDGDLRISDGRWSHNEFRGNKWQRVIKEERQNYLINSYRVLMTRARQGMILVVPDGDDSDPTRSPAFYDHTYEYLRSIGIPDLVH